MEHHVVIEKLCSCAKKEGLSQITTYDAKDAALEAAETQMSYMNGSFCGKHTFEVVEVNDNFVIGMVGGGCGCK
ncbi:hypothetical protein [Sulfuricurvum sp.]|jgi:hypothetical protein|uniref:hypothetical protein n=1 Tax=Sulfuricurvum sp. TaxID=2025608 RepID=UPI0026286E5C|nr:hypothetical protein [Sulfuricurvum sp.]MDD4950429.1 hypothetical protein [Sulfuricurvum sp.]